MVIVIEREERAPELSRRHAGMQFRGIINSARLGENLSVAPSVTLHRQPQPGGGELAPHFHVTLRGWEPGLFSRGARASRARVGAAVLEKCHVGYRFQTRLRQKCPRAGAQGGRLLRPDPPGERRWRRSCPRGRRRLLFTGWELKRVEEGDGGDRSVNTSLATFWSNFARDGGETTLLFLDLRSRVSSRRCHSQSVLTL